MSIAIKINLNERLYLRDPQLTELGKKILKHSILLMDEIGFEAFNFKKLAAEMESTEASIYRYFENKHLLLIYLVNWYWEWVSYLIDMHTRNIDDAKRCLKIIIDTFVYASKENPSVEYINESVLHRLVIAEGTKTYHTKLVDSENKDGFFGNYKRLVEKVSLCINKCNSEFKYPRALATSLFEMANNHIYFAQHLPRLTDVRVQGENFDEVEQMLEEFAFGILDI